MKTPNYAAQTKAILKKAKPPVVKKTKPLPRKK